MKKLKLHGFNNLTKSLSFCIYDICYAKTAEERDGYIAYIDELYNANRLTEILSETCSIIGANILNIARQDYEPQGASVTILVSEEPVDEIADLPAGSYCIVMTHNHALDLELTAALLKRNDFAYFGLIGSKTKRVKFEHRLRDRGFDAAQLQRMRCPMGLPEVKGKLPVEIAISIAGEIIATYNANFGQHLAGAEPIAKLLPASRRSHAI